MLNRLPNPKDTAGGCQLPRSHPCSQAEHTYLPTFYTHGVIFSLFYSLNPVVQDVTLISSTSDSQGQQAVRWQFVPAECPDPGILLQSPSLCSPGEVKQPGLG